MNAQAENFIIGRKRKQLRLKGYDYSQAGVYFVTICTKNREHLFGEIVDGQMRVSAFGSVVQKCWHEIPGHFEDVLLDAFIIMPNHVHGIIVLLGDVFPVGARSPRPEQTTRATERRPNKKPTLGNVVAYFKYQSTKRINEIHNTPGTKIWQRNYFEHIVRNDRSFDKIRNYVLTNPEQWQYDKENAAKRGIDNFESWLDSEGGTSLHKINKAAIVLNP